MGGHQALEVEQVAFPVGDRFHDDEVLRRRQWDGRTRDLYHGGAGDGLHFKRQTAKGDIHINACGLMAKEQDPGFMRKCQNVRLSREEAERAAGVHKGRPLLFGEQDEGVDVARHSRPSQQGHRQAANDKAVRVLRLPPLHQIG